jgi:hypothetical protein
MPIAMGGRYYNLLLDQYGLSDEQWGSVRTQASQACKATGSLSGDRHLGPGASHPTASCTRSIRYWWAL